ncbi:MAG: glycerol-3-phosphate 1-O-acyltransferase PlsY [Holosporaceae bacterium]
MFSVHYHAKDLPLTLGLLCIVAYFLGNLTFGLLWQHLLQGPDIRQHGSKNVGASNVLRLHGKMPSLITLLGDALKGVLAVLLAKIFFSTSLALYLASLCVLLGHIYPALFKFHGGKGVATLFGLFFTWAWPLGLLLLCVWGLVFWRTKTASASSLAVCVAAPPLFGYLLGTTPALWALILCLLVFWSHRSNIKRLLQRRELVFSPQK